MSAANLTPEVLAIVKGVSARPYRDQAYVSVPMTSRFCHWCTLDTTEPYVFFTPF